MPVKRTPKPLRPLDAIASALRRERERADVSLSELARRANVSKSTLSQLESGTGNPSIETLWALAVALGIPFSRLVDPPIRQVKVIRAGEGAAIRSEQAHFTGIMLSACPPGARRDLYVINLEPGSSRQAQAHIPGSVEHLYVSKGRLRTGPTDTTVELGPGDYATFPGDVPHFYEALAPHTVAVMLMEHV
ncbi:XRE family transcriptional regulator [Myxococcus stipitatus DSM 14675]|uniref:XRE family transcriptional regulator n=1 Tax=Myxococcus stipitatus (strain DSM 14675 / JCM 12634 / Mx s8) TaxID=1278073 RepID=L7UDG3_MYXSD|nr:XRE family transcriptional regulator [Myxococcus stipitatus]AGC46936.1 XRE family transcriptional regulator [Myxococcus stipitatus DSM 14675]